MQEILKQELKGNDPSYLLQSTPFIIKLNIHQLVKTKFWSG